MFNFPQKPPSANDSNSAKFTSTSTGTTSTDNADAFPMDLTSQPNSNAVRKLHYCYNILEYIMTDPTGDSLMLPMRELLYDLQICITQVRDHLTHLAAKESNDVTRKINDIVSDTKMKKSKRSDSNSGSVDLHIEIPRVKGLSCIAGLWETKKLLIVSVLLPLRQPQLFTDNSSVNSVLLYGPPGTGKTNIVHALAFECDAKLQCVSVGSVISSLVGETEKNLRAVFEAFTENDEISILFIDELDGLCRKRFEGEQEHTRRLKTELMCLMSKMAEMRNRFLICATNCPWDLDTAFTRRFQRRVYIPLPDATERVELLRLFAGEHCAQFDATQWQELVDGTAGYSGSDLRGLVQTALNAPIMELADTQLWKLCPDDTYQPLMPTDDVSETTWMHINLQGLPNGKVRARPVRPQDFLDSMKVIKPTVPESSVLQFEKFHFRSMK